LTVKTDILSRYCDVIPFIYFQNFSERFKLKFEPTTLSLHCLPFYLLPIPIKYEATSAIYLINYLKVVV